MKIIVGPLDVNEQTTSAYFWRIRICLLWNKNKTNLIDSWIKYAFASKCIVRNQNHVNKKNDFEQNDIVALSLVTVVFSFFYSCFGNESGRKYGRENIETILCDVVQMRLLLIQSLNIVQKNVIPLQNSWILSMFAVSLHSEYNFFFVYK